MAIKGKKKSQARGSQARRRPAAAPRPAYSSSRRVSWHKTPGGRVALAVALAVAFGIVVAVVAVVRGNQAEQRALEQELDDYTTSVKAFLTKVNPPIGEMLAVPVDPASIDADLTKEAREWSDQLNATLAEVPTAPADLTSVSQLMLNSIQLYIAAADTFTLVPGAEGELRAGILRRATVQRETAAAVFLGAVATLDGERSDLGMSASRIGAPGAGSQPAPPASPAPEQVTVPPQEGDSEGRNDGKGKKRD